MADVNVFVGFALLAMLYSYLLEAVDHSPPHWIRMTIIYRHVLLLIVLVLTLDMVSAARGTPRTSRSDPSAPPTRNLVNQVSPHAVKDEIVLEPVSARELMHPLVPNQDISPETDGEIFGYELDASLFLFLLFTPFVLILLEILPRFPVL